MNHHDVYGKQMQTETLQYKCFCISKIILVLGFWIGNRYTFDVLATLIYFKYISLILWKILTVIKYFSDVFWIFFTRMCFYVPRYVGGIC